jgi:hypothetical protein
MALTVGSVSVTHDTSGATGKIVEVISPATYKLPSGDEVIVVKWDGIATLWAERTVIAPIS